MNIYIGNLSYTTTEDELRQAFEGFGQVNSVNIILDRETGRSRGFAFVEMGSDDEANAAITEMNGKELGGRTLTVNQARQRENRGGRGGGRGGYGNRSW